MTVGGQWLAAVMHEVVTGALVRGGRVLLVHRSPHRAAYPDVWDLPGGHVEAGESELDALGRELREELGVEIAVGSATHLCRLTVGSGADEVRFGAWVVLAWTGRPTNAAPEEHDDLGWFGAAELPVPAHPDLRAVLVDLLSGGLAGGSST